MWWGSGGTDDEIGEEEEALPDLRVQFQEQESLLGQLKGALKSNEAKLQIKEKQVKDIASRLSKSKLEERAREAAAKQTERQLLAQTTGTLPKASPSSTSNVPTTSKKGSKLARLRQELQEAREKEAEMLEGQQSLESKVAALQKELAERDNIIRDYDLASVTGDSVLGSPLSSSPYIMSPERGGSPSSDSPHMGSSFEDVFHSSDKSHRIVELNEKILEYERRILDLEEDLRNKDEVIRARTEAVSAVSEVMSHKGRSVLEELEETKEEMKKMQVNFSESEMDWTKKNMALQVEFDCLDQKLKVLKENESRAEELRFDLSTKNATLQEKIVKLQSDLNIKRMSDSEKEIELVEMRVELDKAKSRLESQEKDVQDRLDKFYDKLSKLFKENEDVDSELGSTIKELQSQLIELEAEKGSLQLRIIDYEDEAGNDLKAELQKLKESLRTKDEEIVELQSSVAEMKSEAQEYDKQLEKKEKELLVYAEQVSELVQGNEEVARSKVAAEMRALELEELKESCEAEKKDLITKMEEITSELKGPFEKLKIEFGSTQEALLSLERDHSECKGRALRSDKELLEKSDKVKEHQIEISQLEKVLQAKTLEISDELAKSDLLEKELERMKEALESAESEIQKKEEEICTYKSSNLNEQISLLDEQLLSLNCDVAEKQEKISGLESTVEDLQIRFDEKEMEITQLSNKYDSINDENRELLVIKDELAQKLKDLENEKAHLSSDVDSNKLKYESETNELSVKIQDIAQEKELLMSKYSTIEEELSKCREEAEKEVGSLNETLTDKNKTIKALGEESESFKMELEVLQEKNSCLSHEVETKNVEIEGLQSKVSEQDVLISELHLRVDSSAELINESQKAQEEHVNERMRGLKQGFDSQLDELNLKLVEFEEEKTSLNNEVQNLKEESESLRSNLRQIQNEKNKLQEEFNSKINADANKVSLVSEKDGIIKHLEESIEDLKAYKDSVKTELSDKISEVTGLKEINNELQTMMSDLKAEIGDKTARIKSLEEELQSGNNNRFVAENDSLKISEYEAIVESKKSELESALSVQSDMTSKINLLETELSLKLNEIKDLTSAKTQLKNELSELRRVRDEATSSENDAERTNLQRCLDEKIKENSTLQDKLDSINVKFNSLEGSYNSLLEGKEQGNVLGERDKFKMKNEQLLDKARKLLVKVKQQDKSIKEKEGELKKAKNEFNKNKEDLTEKWQLELSEKEELSRKCVGLGESNANLEKSLNDSLIKIEALNKENQCLQSKINDLQSSLGEQSQEETKGQIREADVKIEELQRQNSELKKTIDHLNKIRVEFEKEIEELRAAKPSDHDRKALQEKKAEEDESGWDDGFTFDDPVEEEKVVKSEAPPTGVAVSKDSDCWGDDDSWNAWGEEEDVIESSKLEKDSKEQEKSGGGSANNTEYELKIQQLTQDLEKEKKKLEVERYKFSEEEDAFYERIESLEKEVADKDLALKKFEGQMGSIQNSEQLNKEKSDEILKLMNENKERSQLIESLEKQLSSLSNIKENLENQLKTLNDNLSSSLAEKESLEQNISDLETRILEMSKMESELENKNKAYIDVNNQLDAEVSKCASLRTEFEVLSTELQNAQKNLKEISVSEADIRSEYDSLKASFETLQNNSNAHDNERLQQLQDELERLRTESANGQIMRQEFDQNRNEINYLTVERDGLLQQIAEVGGRFEEQRSIEENLHLQISQLTFELKASQDKGLELESRIHQLNESSSQNVESLNGQIEALSQDLESKKILISSSDAQLKELGENLESLRMENEGLNSRVSSLTVELESKSIESANLSQQLEIVSAAMPGNEEASSAFAPPPDVTQYQQQPDVALHSIPQPDIMPSGYVDLVQQPRQQQQQPYYDPHQQLQVEGSHHFYDPSVRNPSQNPQVSLSSTQEVQTELSSHEIDNSFQMLESLSAQLSELQIEVTYLRDTNNILQSSISQEQKNSEESLALLKEELSVKEGELALLRSERNATNAEVGTVSSTLDSATSSETLSGEDSQQSHSIQEPMASVQQYDSSTLEWYKEQFNTYQTAITDWQEWGRVKSEELDGYINGYNEVSRELSEARLALDAKVEEINNLSLTYQQLSNEIQEMRKENEKLSEGKVSADDSWRTKIRAKEIEITDLTETVERLKSEKEELLEEVNELREKNEALRVDRASSEELEDLKYQLDELSEEKRLMSIEINSLKKKQESNISTEENLAKINQKLQGDLDLSNSVIKKLESELKEYENELKKREGLAEDSLKASNNTIVELENESKILKSEIDSLKSQIKSLENDLEKERDEKSALSRDKLSEIDTCTSEMSSLKEELSNIKSSLDTANTALTEWSTWGQTKMNEYDTLLKSYEEYVAAYNAAVSEVSSLKERLNASHESSDKIKENIEVLQGSSLPQEDSGAIEDLKTQLSAALTESEKLKEEVQNVRLRNGKLTVRSKQMEKELEAIKKGSESTDLSKDVSSLQDELIQSSKSLEELNTERLHLTEKVVDLENKVDHLNHDNEVLRNVRADYDNLKMQYDALVTEKSSSSVASHESGLSSTNDKVLIAQLETALKTKSHQLQNLEYELNRLRVVGDTERLELDKSLRENRQLNSQMNYWKQQIYTEQQTPESVSSPQSELHVARQAASAFQVQVEQLTTELTKLQEERDTLQLKLSNVMRQCERQRESSSRASTACSTPIPWMDPSLVEIKELKSKIEELGNLNYALDIELQKERQTREAMQARLRHQSSSSSSSTPVHLPQKSTSDLSSLPGGNVLHL